MATSSSDHSRHAHARRDAPSHVRSWSTLGDSRGRCLTGRGRRDARFRQVVVVGPSVAWRCVDALLHIHTQDTTNSHSVMRVVRPVGDPQTYGHGGLRSMGSRPNVDTRIQTSSSSVPVSLECRSSVPSLGDSGFRTSRSGFVPFPSTRRVRQRCLRVTVPSCTPQSASQGSLGLSWLHITTGVDGGPVLR